jgi:hypothetical protein
MGMPTAAKAQGHRAERTRQMVLIRFDSFSRVLGIPRPAAPPPLATWIADNIEDHLTGGEDHAPHRPSSRLS